LGREELKRQKIGFDKVSQGKTEWEMIIKVDL
jgi:hypothetical protein